MEPPAIQAQVCFLTGEVENKPTPFLNEYDSLFKHHTYKSLHSIRITYANPNNVILLRGEPILCNIWFLYGNQVHVGKLHEGFHFQITEAARIIGEVCITKVFAEELNYWHPETLLKEFKAKQLEDISDSFKYQLRSLHGLSKSAIPLFKDSYFPAHLKLPKNTSYPSITYEDLAILSLGQHKLKCTNYYALNDKRYDLYDIATWNDKSYALCQIYCEKEVIY